jgi:hypothetical protein
MDSHVSETLERTPEHGILVNPNILRLMARFGAYCLLALHKEHIPQRNILLNISSKQPVSPKSGHEPQNVGIYRKGSKNGFRGSYLTTSTCVYLTI